MDNRSDTVRLYCAQSEVVYNVLQKDGVCYSREAYVRKKYKESAKIFVAAYSWYVRKAQAYVPRPAGAEYPYWAFTKQINVDKSGGGIFLTLDVPREEIVFFDLYDWNKILCLKYMGDSESEEEAFRKKLAQMGADEMSAMLTGFYPLARQEIQNSWNKLFRYHDQLKAGEEVIQSVQAGLWRIKKEWIVNAQ